MAPEERHRAVLSSYSGMDLEMIWKFLIWKFTFSSETKDAMTTHTHTDTHTICLVILVSSMSSCTISLLLYYTLLYLLLPCSNLLYPRLWQTPPCLPFCVIHTPSVFPTPFFLTFPLILPLPHFMSVRSLKWINSAPRLGVWWATVFHFKESLK